MDDIAPLLQMFEESEEATRPARRLSERDRDYYDGKQLTDDEERKLKKRGQPPVIYNRIQRKIDFLSGLEKQQRKDPKAFPRTPDDEAAANAATDAIRYICDAENWDVARSQAWDNILIEGTAAIMVGVKKVKDGHDPSIVQIPWDRYFFDPAASRADLSDKQYDGIVTWYDLSTAKQRWPGKDDILEATLSRDRDTETYDDKPKDKLWADAKRKRVRVVELYHLEAGKWTRCVFTGGGYLEPKAPSPYIDEDGKPENPIKSVSLYVDRDNNRYGAVRVLISPQDEINKRRSKGLHLITMRQVRVSPVAYQDPEKVRSEVAKPDGVLVGEKDDVEILETGDMARGNFEMLQEAKSEIDMLGANAALAGKNENDMSGRAILAQQQGGMVEVARMFDRLRSLSIEVYRAIWNRIRQVWKAERWIRVADDERNLKFVGLNQQVTVAMLAQEVAEGKPEALQAAAKIVGMPLLQAYLQGDQQAQMVLGQFVQQHGQEVVETRNAINELDVDIVIDEGMDTPSVQAEQFDTIVKTIPAIGAMMESQAPMAKALVKLIIQSSQLRDKDKLLDIMEPKDGQQEAGPSPEEMMQAQAEALRMEAEAEAATEIQKAEIKATSDIEVAKIKAAADFEIAKLEAGYEASLAETKANTDAQLAEAKAQTDAGLTERKMMLDYEAKSRVDEATGEAGKRKKSEEDSQALREGQSAIMDKLEQLTVTLSKPRKKVPIRDENGLITEVREVMDEAA